MIKGNNPSLIVAKIVENSKNEIQHRELLTFCHQPLCIILFIFVTNLHGTENSNSYKHAEITIIIICMSLKTLLKTIKGLVSFVLVRFG